MLLMATKDFLKVTHGISRLYSMPNTRQLKSTQGDRLTVTEGYSMPLEATQDYSRLSKTIRGYSRLRTGLIKAT